MENWQGLFGGLIIGLIGSLIAWWFKSIDSDKQKGVKLAYDSEKTTETLKKTEQHLSKIEDVNYNHTRSIHSIEENLALFEQREQTMQNTLNRIESMVSDNAKRYANIYSQLVQSNNNIANAITLLSDSLKDHKK